MVISVLPDGETGKVDQSLAPVSRYLRNTAENVVLVCVLTFLAQVVFILPFIFILKTRYKFSDNGRLWYHEQQLHIG